MEDILLSPMVTLLLSFLVLYKWVLKMLYSFKWAHLGAVVSRFIFCVVYAIIIAYEPNADELRNFVRMGLNVLFIDEIINWGLGTKLMAERFCRHFPQVCEFFKKATKKGG